MKVEFLILQKKLLFCFHLADLPLQSLGRDVYDLQVANSLGIFSECKEHLEKIGISDLTTVNKYQWRKIVKRYISKANKSSLLDSMKSSKKLNHDELASESFIRKPYFFNMDLESVRYRFRISSKMVDVKANFPRKYRSSSLNCPSCRIIMKKKEDDNNEFKPPSNDPKSPAESQSHLMDDCLAFDELRDKYDLTQDDQIVSFFKEALTRRDQLEIQEERI